MNKPIRVGAVFCLVLFLALLIYLGVHKFVARALDERAARPA